MFANGPLPRLRGSVPVSEGGRLGKTREIRRVHGSRWRRSTSTSVSHTFRVFSPSPRRACSSPFRVPFTLLFANAVVLGFVTVVGLCSLTSATTFDRRDNCPRNDPSITRRIYLVTVWWIVQMYRVNGSAWTHRRNCKGDIFALCVNINQSARKECSPTMISNQFINFCIWEARRDVKSLNTRLAEGKSQIGD